MVPILNRVKQCTQPSLNESHCNDKNDVAMGVYKRIPIGDPSF